MKSIKKHVLAMFFIMAFHGNIFAFDHVDRIDLSDCRMVRVELQQIIIAEEGCYLIDEVTNVLTSVDGFINQNGEIYALVGTNFDGKKATSALCEKHGRGCSKCLGCVHPKCWNYCMRGSTCGQKN